MVESRKRVNEEKLGALCAALRDRTWRQPYLSGISMSLSQPLSTSRCKKIATLDSSDGSLSGKRPCCQAVSEWESEVNDRLQFGRNFLWQRHHSIRGEAQFNFPSLPHVRNNPTRYVAIRTSKLTSTSVFEEIDTAPQTEARHPNEVLGNSGS